MPNPDSSIEDLRALWHEGQTLGAIVVIDGPYITDKPDTRCALLCSTVGDNSIIRCPLTKQEAINLSRALIESVS